MAVLCLVVILGAWGSALGQLGRTFEVVIALDPGATSALSFIDEGTFSSLGVEYALANSTFGFAAALTPDALERVAFDANMQLESIGLDSSLTFYPIGDEKALLKTTIAPKHQYNLWSVYYVDSLGVENVNSSLAWYVQVRVDGTSCTMISPVLGSETHTTGSIAVGMVVKYVEVVALTGLLESSFVSPELLFLEYSNSVWRSDLSIEGTDVGIYSTFVLPIAGSPKLVTMLSGPILDGAWLSASVEFLSDLGECDLGFHKAVAQVTV